jgi:hypothetical protein
MRATSIRDIELKKFVTFPFDGAWKDAFEQPEQKGCWFIYGESGQGKSSFALQFAKYLSQWKKVGVNSIEEGVSLALKKRIKLCGLTAKDNISFYDRLSIKALTEVLAKRKSIDIVIIDSVQYLVADENNDPCEFAGIKRMMNQFPSKLFIFISQCENKKPLGTVANKVLYDADLKIYVEGFRAISKGRYIGDKGSIDINTDKANKYYGNKK